MGKFSADAASIGPAEYRRTADPREAQLVARYAADLGMCMYTWNGAMSAVFFLYLAAQPTGADDPQESWRKLGTDRAKLQATAARMRKADYEGALGQDVAWAIERLTVGIGFRNAVTHFGLVYAAGDLAADPYGKTDHAAIVTRFLEQPASLGAFVGDLRVLRQFVEELGLEAAYGRIHAGGVRATRPDLLFLSADPQEEAART